MATELEIVNSALVKIGAPLTTQESYAAGKTKEDRVANNRLESIKKDLLRSHPWNCAIKRTKSIIVVSSADTTGTSNPKTVSVNALPYTINSGTALVFSGGRTLTLTSGAYLGATSITGNLDDASKNITKNETSSKYGTVGTPAFDYSYSVPLPTDLIRLLDVNDSDKEYRIEKGQLISDHSDPSILYVYDLPMSSFDPSMTEALAWRLASEIAYAVTQNPKVIEITSRGYQIALSNAKTADAQEDGRYYLEAELFDDSRFGSSIFTDYRNHHRP